MEKQFINPNIELIKSDVKMFIQLNGKLDFDNFGKFLNLVVNVYVMHQKTQKVEFNANDLTDLFNQYHYQALIF